MRMGKYLSSLTKPELEFIINNCNFNDDELHIFNCLSKSKSVQEIAFALGMSTRTVDRRIKNLSNKIERSGIIE